MGRHFAQGKADPKFRTKLALALELVDAASAAGITFRAVVADCFYGEDETLKAGLRERHVGYVLALKLSHAWRLYGLWRAWSSAPPPPELRRLLDWLCCGHGISLYDTS